MKIVTWNCNGAFRNKHHALDDLGADILVIQECEDPSCSDVKYREWTCDYLWAGENKNKGIGIFSKNGYELAALKWNADGLQSFLPCRVDDSVNLIGVWTKQANSPNFRYIGQLWKYLQLHKDKIGSGSTIICGDLNSNVQWDEWDRWWNHSDVVRELEEINIHSLYHQIMREEQGKESKPTLFLHRRLEKPYHIDYAFLSRNLLIGDNNMIEVGSPEIWLKYSDHMPVVFSIAL